ncbi:probable chitinase 10 [Episyrphus balteatus]|uniref:probable chitinase 10 n=1 Tax=Episyrphus balteatus TaxID=286459 RepID=UPI0024868E79|nr:probable chitinase 10 [Episyrphus balteatus]
MYRSLTIISGLFFLQIAPVISGFETTSHSVKVLRSPKEPECRGKKVGSFVRDPYSCDKFYYCGPDETAIVVDCPHEMIFNDEKEICDFPSNYHCVPRIKEDEDGGISTTTTEKPQITTSILQETSLVTSSKPKTTLSTVSTEMVTPTTMTTPSTISTTTLVTIENKCPLKDTKKLIFLPHPGECQRYYICYHGLPVPQECISELHWNAKTNQCDFPEKAGCLESTTTVVVPSTATVPVEVLINCPFRGEQIYPHPVHCNYFIYCIYGYATIQQCPFYHHFDIYTKKCLWQTVATCIVRK